MNYRKDKYGNEISILGYGCMRFSQSAGKINLEKAEKEIMKAYENGVNYFDTAYIYPGSEVALGKILAKNQIREQVKIATKLPHYMIKSIESMEKTFQEQLKRLQTDYIDYYLMHMLTDVATWEKLVNLGIVQWLQEKVKSGAILQVGFSYHGNSDMFCKLVDAYDWDFTQIQYNYLDENTQAGKKGLHYAAKKGIPVIIMEPLRGGRLVTHLPDQAIEIMKQHIKQHTPVQWALRWLWNQPEVTCVLSGMNSLEMVEDNVTTASHAEVGELDEQDEAMLQQVVQAIHAKMKVGCTGCGYCMPCPKNVDIPGTFAIYNNYFSDKKKAWEEYLLCTAMRKTPSSASNCIECGKCEQHCPQQIEIRKNLKDASKKLETPIYKIARKFIKWLKLYG